MNSTNVHYKDFIYLLTYLLTAERNVGQVKWIHVS